MRRGRCVIRHLRRTPSQLLRHCQPREKAWCRCDGSVPTERRQRLIEHDLVHRIGHDVHGSECARCPIPIEMRRVLLHDALIQDEKYEICRIVELTHLVPSVFHSIPKSHEQMQHRPSRQMPNGRTDVFATPPTLHGTSLGTLRANAA